MSVETAKLIDPMFSCATCKALTKKQFCPVKKQQVKTPTLTTCREGPKVVKT